MMPNFNEGFRAAGLLLHPSSLDSPFGIGDLGPSAHKMAATIKKAGFHYWQVLPMSHTSPALGNSPYSAFSAFAGDPLLISPELMAEEGWLKPGDLDKARLDSGNFIDFEKAAKSKGALYNLAFERAGHKLLDHGPFTEFLDSNADWLNDFAFFMAAKAHFGGQSWAAWPEAVKRREEAALRKYGADLARPILAVKFQQYLFHHQLAGLKKRLYENGLALIGDVAIYVNHDSADVWANQRLFHLNDQGLPTVVAGVPPDYFSQDGQLWGNPIFNWDRHRSEGFGWWRGRMKRAFQLCDWVRLDHFRAFCAYWEVEAGQPTARAGAWRPGPGAGLFESLSSLGPLNIIAEDLGVITPDVTALRKRFGLPGMRVMQFAFGPDMPFSTPAPFRIEADNVVYTGTHDNNTTRGWFTETAAKLERGQLSDLAGFAVTEDNAAWALTRLVFLSPGGLAVCPMQDFLNLGQKARLNTPGTASGNWAWKMGPNDLPGEKDLEKMGRLIDLAGRDNREHPNILTY